MDPINTVIVIFVSAILVGLVLERWLKDWRVKNPPENTFSDQELDNFEHVKPTFTYKVFAVFFVLFYIGIPLAISFFIFVLIREAQKAIVTNDYLVWLPGESTFLVMILAFFVALLLNSLILTFTMKKWFPKYNQMMSKDGLRFVFMGQVVENRTKPDAPHYISFLVHGFLGLTLFTSLIAYLAIDNYYYVDSEAIHVNSFLSLKERSVDLDNIVQVRARVGMNSSGDGKPSVGYEYTLWTSGIAHFNFHGAHPTDLNKLHTLVEERGIPVVAEADPEALAYSREQYSEEMNRFFTRVFIENE